MSRPYSPRKCRHEHAGAQRSEGATDGMTQGELFAPEGEYLTRNPMCLYETHCGRGAVLGPWEDRGGCVNRTITPIGCRCRGEASYTYAHDTKHGWKR